MVAVPLSALLALWIFATTVTAGPAINLLEARDAVVKLGEPGLRLISQLQRERHFSAIYESAVRPARTELARERGATDQIVAEFRQAAAAADANEEVKARVDDMLRLLGSELPGIRQQVDKRDTGYYESVQDFSRIIDSAFEVSRTAAVFFYERVDRESRGLIAAYRGLEYLSRIDALLGGATAEGRIDAQTRKELIACIGAADYLIASGVADMPEESQGDYARLITNSTFIKLDELKNKLLTTSYVNGPPPVDGVEWQSTYDYVAGELQSFGDRVVGEIAEDATPLAIEIIARLVAAALLGLAALGLSVYVSARLGRSLVGRLIRLRRDALELASERLPSVVRRLQRGESVDVDVETPPLEYGQDEIGQLGRAFNDVQRTAVQSAVDEADVRRGINEVFLNIARRSQTLLHRQLSLLDKMERRETGPQELEDLYRVDHLATRMRRHAEDLVILAGAAPGRGWRNPVPVIDVIRGAISEVEDYKRVDIRAVAGSAMVGRAVGDVIHLLAELIENAASFSPPHTRVQVSGQVLPNGYAVEIEDRGLGMAPEAMEHQNRRLSEPPDFDPADSARLGLFVVSQLAHRHHIRVSLRASAYGGVTAVVLVPGALVASGPDTGPLVGTGRDDPSRDSLAGLQWQGSGELRQITTSGRRTAPDDAVPGTVNGLAVNGRSNGVALPSSPHRPAPEQTGPAPSVVAAELSAEGLVQRRRVRKPTLPKPTNGADPAKTDPNQTVDLSVLDQLAAGLPVTPRAVPRNSAPAVEAPAEDPMTVDPAVGDPMIVDPVIADAVTDVPAVEDSAATTQVIELPTPGPAAPPAPVDGGDDGLPKRVRQANLAPQLRKRVVEPEPTAPARTPEQARSLMSSLQSGTTRGRIAAAREEAGHAVGPAGVTSGDAATVSFPALAHPAPTGTEAQPTASGTEAHPTVDGREGHPATSGARAHLATSGDAAHSMASGEQAYPATSGEKAPSGPEAGVDGDHAEGPGENLLLEKDA
ncbi:nitrate- and nitrite sensing domain-containing protein [Actinoplanes utahensis]|nr:histidine kinase [Actinoplanes utahensis]